MDGTKTTFFRVTVQGVGQIELAHPLLQFDSTGPHDSQFDVELVRVALGEVTFDKAEVDEASFRNAESGKAATLTVAPLETRHFPDLQTGDEADSVPPARTCELKPTTTNRAMAAIRLRIEHIFSSPALSRLGRSFGVILKSGFVCTFALDATTCRTESRFQIELASISQPKVAKPSTVTHESSRWSSEVKLRDGRK